MREGTVEPFPDDPGDDPGESVAPPELAVQADGGKGASDALTRDVVELTAGDLGKNGMV